MFRLAIVIASGSKSKPSTLFAPMSFAVIAKMPVPVPMSQKDQSVFSFKYFFEISTIILRQVEVVA